LNALFGYHAFFSTIINLADWSDDGLVPHGPQPTEVVAMLERKH
jgi:hypothetical protein